MEKRHVRGFLTFIAIFLLVNTSFVAPQRKRKCKDVYEVAWWEYPPYIYKNQDGINGIFPKVIEQMVQGCCQSLVNVSFSKSLASRTEAVEQVVNGTADLVAPLIVKTGKTKLLSFPFISYVDSPGVAFYTASPSSAGESLVQIIVASFPILILSLVLTLIAGTLFWIFEYQHDEMFGLAILGRIQDGIWWAFVSMTTVGYGDVYPKTKSGQILAVIWILLGIFVVSLFVANVSSFLTTSCFSQKTDLRGNKIAVIRGSQEHSLAVRGSSIPVECNGVSELAKSMKKGPAVGGLLDSYVAGYYQDLFREFRLNDLREDFFSYGVVLKPSVMSQERCFRDFIASHQTEIFELISENITPLKKTREKSTAEEMSSSLLHFHSFATYVPLAILFGIICTLFAIGYLRQLFHEDKNNNQRQKSFHRKIRGENDALEAIEKHHLRELANCLQNINRDSALLQDCCSKVLSRAELEANMLLGRAFIEKETCV